MDAAASRPTLLSINLAAQAVRGEMREKGNGQKAIGKRQKAIGITPLTALCRIVDRSV